MKSHSPSESPHICVCLFPTCPFSNTACFLCVYMCMHICRHRFVRVHVEAQIYVVHFPPLLSILQILKDPRWVSRIWTLFSHFGSKLFIHWSISPPLQYSPVRMAAAPKSATSQGRLPQDSCDECPDSFQQMSLPVPGCFSSTTDRADHNQSGLH